MRNNPMQKISVTIPVHNEVENIPILYDRLIATLTPLGVEYEIIFVNDGSNDGSRAAIDRLVDQDANVKAVHFTRNFGQTAAMMAGFDYSSGDIIVPMDADLQNDPKDIPRLLEKIAEGYDVVSGWRKERKDNTIKRTLVSRLANKLISTVSGVKLRDYGCTMKAYRKGVIKGVRLYGEMHRFVPIYASWEGARICELPVTHHPRIHGRSKYGLERTFKVLLDLIVIVFLDNYAQKPIYVFGGFGIFCFLFSFVNFFYATYLKFFEGRSYIETPLPMLSMMTFVTGIMCILMGLLAEMIMRTYYESQQKRAYLVDVARNVKDRE